MTKELDEGIKILDQLRRTAFEKKHNNKPLTKEEEEIINIPNEIMHKFYKIEQGGRTIEIPMDLPSLG